jgi:hypothetical protein
MFSGRVLAIELVIILTDCKNIKSCATSNEMSYIAIYILECDIGGLEYIGSNGLINV